MLWNTSSLPLVETFSCILLNFGFIVFFCVLIGAVQFSDKLSPPRSSNGPIHPATPYPTGMPTLLNLRHLTKSTDGGFINFFNYRTASIFLSLLFLISETPNNNTKPFSDTDSWTPFSSVSDRASCAHDDRASACVSLMDDLSQSTISATPIGDMRQQLVTVIESVGSTCRSSFQIHGFSYIGFQDPYLASRYQRY